MIRYYRFRRLAASILLYCVTGAVGSYFVWQTIHGERGLQAKAEYKQQMTQLQQKMVVLMAQHEQWQHRVNLIRGPTIDRDLLDEEARGSLDQVRRSDLVIFLPTTSK